MPVTNQTYDTSRTVVYERPNGVWHLGRIKAGLDINEVLRRHPDWKRVTRKPPTLVTVARRAALSETNYATDGCKVEPDGVCQHGHPSWALVYGVI